MFEMKTSLTFAFALAGSMLFAVPGASASEALCLEAVKEQHYERLTTVCVELPHRNRLEKMRLLMSGNFKHHLGTVDQPTEAFALLKSSAEDHNANAQYMYSQLYGTVHNASAEHWESHPSNDGTVSLRDYNAQVKLESTQWLNRAAENGHTLALLKVAEDMLLSSYTSDDINLRDALNIAKRANESHPTLAASLISRLKKRISEY